MRFRSGISGKDPGDPPLFLNRRLFVEPKNPRTPIPEVVAAIEARRLQKYRRKSPQKRRLPPPRRKIIYDDFGEPLRRIWLGRVNRHPSHFPVCLHHYNALTTFTRSNQQEPTREN